MMHAVPAVMIECDDDKENLPSEADFEDMPGMYKEEEDEEAEEATETSTRRFPQRGLALRTYMDFFFSVCSKLSEVSKHRTGF